MPHEYYNTHGVLGRRLRSVWAATGGRLGSARAAGTWSATPKRAIKKAGPNGPAFLLLIDLLDQQFGNYQADNGHHIDQDVH